MQFSTHKYASKGGQDLSFNLFVNAADDAIGPRPLIIFSFGGGRETGDRGNASAAAMFDEFLRAGFAVAAIDYRLGIKLAKRSGEMNQQNGTRMYLRAIQWGVENLFDATRYLVQHASARNVDPSLFVTLGGSSGATNSLVAQWNVANATPLATAHLPAGFRYAGVISMAGAFWLEAGTPLRFATRPAPIMCFHGAQDWLVTYDENQKGFAGYGPAYYFREFPGPDYPKWFFDYPDGDHVIAGLPITNRTLEMRAFMERMVINREPLSIHTIEVSKVPSSFKAMLKGT